MSAVDDATPNRQTARPGLRGWLRDLGAVVALGGRLWVRSWPVLLLVALLAVAGRYAAGWAAVNAAGYHGALGWAVLVLAPLSMATYLIRQGTERSQYGYASAVAIILFVISFILAGLFQAFVLNRDAGDDKPKQRRKKVSR